MYRDDITQPSLSSSGAVAMFPRGAINSPELFASTCILFDSVTVLKQFDLDATHWNGTDDFWEYTPHPNPNADEFWIATKDLIREGVLIPFEPPNATRYLESSAPPDDELRADLFTKNFGGPGWYSTWHAIGFSSYFDYVDRTRVAVVLSAAETPADGSFGNGRVVRARIPELTGLCAKLLSECIPEISVTGESPSRFAGRICAIREKTLEERTHFKSFVGLISGAMAEHLTDEERIASLESISRDYVDVWHAYRSKLSEVARRLKTPLRFASIVQSVITLDFIKAAEKAFQPDSKDLFSRREKRSLGFLRSVEEVNDFWTKGRF